VAPDAVRLRKAWVARFGRLLLIGLALMLHGGSTLAQTQTAPEAGNRQAAHANSLKSFDIPSQSLEGALKAFSALTGIALFYESSIVQGRRSSSVEGLLPVETALDLLLRETGLASTSFDRDTITILQVPATEQLGSAKARVAAFAPYLARLQKSMDLAFCDESHRADDPDDIVTRVWIAPSGRISRAELLWTTGSEPRDRAYIAAIGAVSTSAPPAAMPQPVTMMIDMRASRSVDRCRRAGIAMRPAPHE
jgi:hypothetical protein